jgi:hypothetical protein
MAITLLTIAALAATLLLLVRQRRRARLARTALLVLIAEEARVQEQGAHRVRRRRAPGWMALSRRLR